MGYSYCSWESFLLGSFHFRFHTGYGVCFVFFYGIFTWPRRVHLRRPIRSDSADEKRCTSYNVQRGVVRRKFVSHHHRQEAYMEDIGINQI